MSTISVCVVTNTWTEYDSEKEKTLKQDEFHTDGTSDIFMWTFKFF